MRMTTKLEQRAHLGWLCNQYKLKKAVEIGTHQGVFADQFMNCFFGKLLCIDSWQGSPPETELWYPCFIEQNNGREFDRKVAELVLEYKYPNRVSFLSLKSLQAAKVFRDSEFDFIYIDALHDQASVEKDLEAWWPKLKRGGIFAGHDYDSKDPTTVGVVKAVDKFVMKYKRTLRVTEEENYPSWYMRK